MKVPVIEIPHVYHVGTLNPDFRQRNTNGCSYEGACLSVSDCPEAWRRIARLNGPTWVLNRPGSLFLDLHAARAESTLNESVREFGVRQGLVIEKTAWRAWTYDEESDDWRFSLHASQEDAFAEADADGEYEDPESVPGPDERPGVEPTRVLVATQILAHRVERPDLAQGVEDASDFLWMAWAEECVPEEGGRLDGVWWRDTYAPELLSAPRGGIFPDRMKDWTAHALPAGVTPASLRIPRTRWKELESLEADEDHAAQSSP